MRYLRTFENLTSQNLIIIDVQKSFRKFFSEMYLHELKRFCENFQNVYQIWDNHHEGKNVDKDYLYDNSPEIPISDDLYFFPNQKELIEKRYNYDVDGNFYKKILDEDILNKISQKEQDLTLKVGEIFPTNKGTYIVYIGNNHKWHHLSKKLYDLLMSLSGKDVTIVGGADSECLEDIYIAAKSLGVNIKRNWKYIYSASHCPIK
jgi:hypothetical protein